jgi:hypothetical protein
MLRSKFSDKFFEQIFGQIFRTKLSNKGFGQIFRTKLSNKIFEQSFRTLSKVRLDDLVRFQGGESNEDEPQRDEEAWKRFNKSLQV